jgi:predicted alpha/beta superfamily hydrolase
VLLALAAPCFGQDPLAGTITKTTLKSAVLGEDRVILVRTPPGYEANKASYPVLYLTDGDAHIGHTASTIAFLARNGRISDLIIVGITNTDRTRDLTPVKSSALNGAGALQFPTSGGADKFLKFIETELIPNIEQNYRTKPYRILSGHSLGGLFAIHALMARPGVFKAYVAVSPALQWEDEEAVKRAETFFKSQKELNATLYVSLGNEPGPIGESFDSFNHVLTKTQIKDFEWKAERMADEDHGSVVLPSHYAGLRKVYDGWLIPRDAATGAIAGGLKGADEHYQKLSQRFGYPIPVPEGVINQLGYQLLFGGKTDEAIATFKANIERYPQSANVYDSLAEAYERGGQIEVAQPLYEKAQALGAQNRDPNAALYKANFERASEKMRQAQAKKNQQ